MTGANAEFDDATRQCTWVEEGVRCTGSPVIGSARSSCCVLHAPVRLPAPPDEEPAPLTPEQSINRENL